MFKAGEKIWHLLFHNVWKWKSLVILYYKMKKYLFKKIWKLLKHKEIKEKCPLIDLFCFLATPPAYSSTLPSGREEGPAREDRRKTVSAKDFRNKHTHIHTISHSLINESQTQAGREINGLECSQPGNQLSCHLQQCCVIQGVSL